MMEAEIDPTGIESTYFMEYDGKKYSLEDYRNVPQNNYQDEIFRTAWQQSHNVRLSGGSETVRYAEVLKLFDIMLLYPITIRKVFCLTQIMSVCRHV